MGWCMTDGGRTENEDKKIIRKPLRHAIGITLVIFLSRVCLWLGRVVHRM